MNEIVKRFTNKKMKKIVNVYQLDYVNGKSPGLGDFLRGSFCFMQLAQLLNLEFEIDISNHPISKYIENASHIEGIDYNNIFVYDQVNQDSRGSVNYEGKPTNINMDFLNKTISLLNSNDCEVFGLFSNAFPCFNKHTKEGKTLINSKLQPNELMRTYIDNTLNDIGLSKKGYGVIHIRTGDKYLIEGRKMSNIFIEYVKTEINKFIIHGRRYLIISDSNYLKSCLKTLPNLYVFIRDIEHLGGEGMKNHNSNGVMNTMLEYYLMSYSNAIVSMSIYGHVSGFSKYCSIVNDIPFNYIRIKEL
jgi:hypothetical protein